MKKKVIFVNFNKILLNLKHSHIMNLIKRYLLHPLTREYDINNPITTEIRSEIIKKKNICVIFIKNGMN